MMNQPASSSKFVIDLEPIGRRVEIKPGMNLLEAAHRAGIDLVASCGGIGICGTCKVRVIQGQVTPVTLNEEEALDADQLARGFRLACQTIPQGDVRVDVPAESLTTTQQLQVKGEDVALHLEPSVIAVDLELVTPSIEDLTSDMTRVNVELASKGYAPLRGDLAMISRLSAFLRQNNWKARVAIYPQILEASPHAASWLVSVLPIGSPLYGLAMDIGSTKVAIFLLNLEDGGVVGETGIMNVQIAYGEDVVSRIAFANRNDESRKELQQRLVESINVVMAGFCEKAGICRDHVVDVTAVGNTAIHHFFAGLPVEQLGQAPYVPVVGEPLRFRASEIGLNVADGAYVFMPSNIAGYVGADHVSALLATHSYASNQTTVLVDIGTNTEISLVYQGKVRSCSTASGPAFEGAHISDGMRAAAGAIDAVHLTASSIKVTTIGGVPPIGICGTGILKGIAEMLMVGAIDNRGVLNQLDDRVRAKSDGVRGGFVLVKAQDTGHGRDIVITRKDVNEIQLAKGAIRTGIDVLLREAGISSEDIEVFIVAGAFGTYLDLKSAIRIGMFPNLPLERFRQVGNAAGVGARQMLLSNQRRSESAGIVGRVTYIELTTYPDFTPLFVKWMYFSDKEDL